jgi:hypothetical protein
MHIIFTHLLSSFPHVACRLLSLLLRCIGWEALFLTLRIAFMSSTDVEEGPSDFFALFWETCKKLFNFYTVHSQLKDKEFISRSWTEMGYM